MKLKEFSPETNPAKENTVKKNSICKHLIIGLIIAVTALYLTYRKTGTAELIETLQTVDWLPLLFVFPPLALSYLFRIFRWKLLLSPVAKVSAAKATGPLLTGFMVNSILPGRVGEILRSVLLSRKTGVPGFASFATVVLARIFDGLTLGLMTLVVLVKFWDELSSGIRLGLMGAIAMYICVLLILVALKKWNEKAAYILTSPFRWIRLETVATKLEEILMSFSKGLAVLKDAKETISIILLSLCVWICLSLSVVPVFLVMGQGIHWYYPLLVLILAGLGMLIPTPAGTGTVHGALVIGLPVLGLSMDAGVFAFLFHTTQFLPIIMAGLVAAVIEGVSASDVRRIAEEDPQERTTGHD
ncbi:MAG: flippase-like domain-containing protein [FCB group bacterium]|nr:flippase-like domain-containing protein [FCB group bacterium]